MPSRKSRLLVAMLLSLLLLGIGSISPILPAAHGDDSGGIIIPPVQSPSSGEDSTSNADSLNYEVSNPPSSESYFIAELSVLLIKLL
ncbi:exported hypothetical protein [Candidatus Zixiibacteriota bacterium]|nr:exported hypothetical protein [candidate division Zixibacteria bacterium]